MFFKDIIGQNQIKRHLIENVQNGRIAHAQLFYGNSGTGALPAAMAYAQYICCENRLETDSCGVCPSCRQMAKLIHPDIHFVFPIINIKNSVCDEFLPQFREVLLENPYLAFDDWLSVIRKENTMPMIYAREGDEIIRKLSFKSFQSSYKIMIIWCADKMNEDCANKVLKILEEPTGRTVFLLITEHTEKIISTILSRTQPLFFPPLTKNDLQGALAKQGIYVADGDFDFLIRNAEGSWSELLKSIKQSGEQKEFFEIFQLLTRLSYMFKVENMKELNTKIALLGRSAQVAFLQFSQRLLRESFVFGLNNSGLSYINQAETAFINGFSKFINGTNIERLMNEFALAEAHIEQNGNAKIIFFDLMIKLHLILNKKYKQEI
ncbi:MAG: DNA polymerase III subunit [Prevotellaceae bacterium]|jgi:DNA polymerase-3 subunit delta'|nr:DNA polymerase III subunit [Prevotellaceae bacterium]